MSDLMEEIIEASENENESFEEKKTTITNVTLTTIIKELFDQNIQNILLL
ncbi:22086_t:CDS:2 [Entrophospora sp. SA101]|nr:22086_t:CDS:2 [Entrophospora sp. SA101]